MIRALAAGVLLSGAGCAQLAGIDSTSGSGRIGDTLALQRTSIGATVVSSPLDLTGLSASYLVDGEPPQPAASSVAGTWQIDLADPAPVEFTLPDVPTPIPRLFAFAQRAMAVTFAVLEHANRAPAPAAAMVTLTAPLDATAVAGGPDAFQVYTVGSWTVRGLAAAELPAVPTAQIGPITYDFSTSASITGRPLERITPQDAIFVLRYTGAALTGVAEAPGFDQLGTDTVTTGTMVPVAASQTLDVKVDPATIMTRFAAVRPAMTGLAMSWSAVAAPGYLLASNAGPALQSGPLAMTDVGVTASYGNPFAARGWNTIFTLATSETRTYTPAGAPGPATLFTGMNQFAEPAANLVLALPAGLPVSISLGGVPLLTDGTKLAQPTAPVEVTFTTDNAMATLYNLQLFDLVPNTAATALEAHLMLSAAGSAPAFAVPPELFKPGHSYTLRAFATVGGYPNVATGDFQTRALPLSQSYFDSAVITVTP